jgi:preprotein translocase subunit YajC
MFQSFLLMTGAPAEGGQQGNPMITLGFFALIFLVFYFLIIRPQQKRQKEHQAMLKEVQNGDRVMTTGGLIGNVVGSKEENGVEVLVIKIAENTKVEVSRGSVSTVIAKNV